MKQLDKIFRTYVNETYSKFNLRSGSNKINNDVFQNEYDDNDITERMTDYQAKRHNEIYLDYLNDLIINKGAIFIDEDGLLSSHGSIMFTKEDFPEQVIRDGRFIVQFGTVQDFVCIDCGLTTLKGCPLYSTNGINCSSNNLKDLQYCPISSDKNDPLVGRNFNIMCSNNPELTSLNGCRMEQINILNCSHTSLKSLEFAPHKLNRLNCAKTKMTSLEGDVIECAGSVDCSHNPDLLSLSGILKMQTLTALNCPNLQIDIDNLPEINGLIQINGKIYKSSSVMKAKLS